MNLYTRVRLNNDVEMPWLGYGTYKVRPEEAYRCVRDALDVGYRLIDTAAYYRNESEVGRAVRDSGIDREEIFITTKVWNTDQGYENTLRAFEDSLKKLGVDYVDLYLVHWPVPGKYLDTWKALVKIYEDGKAMAIGVSNFMEEHLDHLLEHSDIVPAVNQVELHPRLFPRKLVEKCRKEGIQVQAWSPLMQGRIVDIRELQEIGEKYGKTAAQVTLRWILQHGIATIPRSIRKEHMMENTDVFDFYLTLEDMHRIDMMDRGERVGPDPRKIG